MADTAGARRVAWEVLRAVRVDGAYANLLLPARIERARLSGQDAGFATELCYGTLRMRGYYDRVLEVAARRPVSAIDPDVLDVLRLGAHQVLTLSTAKHAAVNESVELTAAVAGRRATGFVNGVLRTLTRSDPAVWRERVLSHADGPTDALAAEYSHPAWVVDALRAALAEDTSIVDAEASLTDLLAADNTPARPSLVTLPGLAPDDPPGTLPGHLSPVARALAPDADLRALDEVRRGTVRVQDEGSQIAALALSRARPAFPGETWLDLCAGPGGKSALLAAEARTAGTSLIANEVNAARAGLVRSALRVFDPAPQVWERDGRTVGETDPGRFDRILVDAPCTGLGALRRRPESRWRRTPEDLTDLLSLQRELLDSAVAALAPGGILAYVTCSPHLEETRRQVGALLSRHTSLRTLPTADIVDAFTLAPLPIPPGTERADVQLWPQRDSTDAMFIALFESA